MVRMTSGSVTSAMTRRVPPQYGQVEISISNTRLSRCAQVSGAVGVAGLPEGWGFEGLIEVSCLRRTRRGEEGTIARPLANCDYTDFLVCNNQLFGGVCSVSRFQG